MKKEDFLEVVDTVIYLDTKYLVVAVEGVGEKEELIINHKDNIKAKREYYNKNYDENMRLVHNKNIGIVYVAGWTHLSFYEEGQS